MVTNKGRRKTKHLYWLAILKTARVRRCIKAKQRRKSSSKTMTSDTESVHTENKEGGRLVDAAHHEWALSVDAHTARSHHALELDQALTSNHLCSMVQLC
jgi:hypothetical protein